MRRALILPSHSQHVRLHTHCPRWDSTRSTRSRKTRPPPPPPPPPKQHLGPKAQQSSSQTSPLSANARRKSIPPHPSGPVSNPVSSERVRKYQAPALLAAALLAGGIAFYCASLYIAATKPCENPEVRKLENQKDVASVYDSTADGFDSEVAFSEWIGGVSKIRKQLASKCKGHVLEVSCGTGRNLGYYDLITEQNPIRSLTFVDLSPQMIDVCKRKWGVLYDSKKRSMRKDLGIRFLTGSALDPMPLAPSPLNGSKDNNQNKYTTIIQTMGLCSTPSPVGLVENLAAHLDRTNPEARIYLLEHGRSYTQWLNRILDNSAEKHADIHGCWYNRDIGALVNEAASKSGLEIVWERRHTLGTVWVFELKARLAGSNDNVANQQDGSDGPAAADGWWNVIRIR